MNQKKVSKSEFVNKMYYYYKNDSDKRYKINIKKVYKGAQAFKKAILLFFGKNNNESKKWAKKWTSSEKSQCIFLVYILTMGVKRITKYINFRLLIKSKKNSGSDLGERFKYKKGKLNISDYK